MRFKSPLIAVSAVGMLALSACGGSGSSSNTSGTTPSSFNPGATGNNQDPTAKGPVTIPNAQKGGIVTVLTLGGLQLPQFLDPSTSYYTDTSSIESGLVTRSLTQYKYDPTSKQMVLVPDLATDLGQHNDSFTKWTFTIRSGIKFEDGTPVTAKNIVWGIQRCMDSKTWAAASPCQPYANGYFRGGAKYLGPYTAPNQKFTAAKASGNTLTIFMDKPFPDMPYFGTFPAMGPIPLSKSASDPKTYLKHPLATGPYMFKTYQATKELVLTKNPNWDPATDPARTQYPDGYDFQLQTPQVKVDQILLADTGSGQTTLTYDDLLAPDYAKMQRTAPDRLTLGGQPCTFYIAPDNRTITNKLVREALSWAWPYRNYMLAKGLIEGVTALPANNLMPPGVPGRKPYNVTGRKDFQTDPNKAKQLLQQANAMGYEIKFVFATDDPTSVKGKDAIVKALTQAGFKATPVPSTVNKAPAVRDDPNAAINIRSAGWCSDWPSGATWIPPLLQNTDIAKSGAFGQNYAAFNNKSVDNQMSAIQQLPLDKQADAWNQLDKNIATKYFPLFPTYYGGIAQAHGSKIMGDNDDNTLGMPTWKDIWISQ